MKLHTTDVVEVIYPDVIPSGSEFVARVTDWRSVWIFSGMDVTMYEYHTDFAPEKCCRTFILITMASLHHNDNIV